MTNAQISRHKMDRTEIKPTRHIGQFDGWYVVNELDPPILPAIIMFRSRAYGLSYYLEPNT